MTAPSTDPSVEFFIFFAPGVPADYYGREVIPGEAIAVNVAL
jgi:hypothetical protein